MEQWEQQPIFYPFSNILVQIKDLVPEHKINQSLFGTLNLEINYLDLRSDLGKFMFTLFLLLILLNIQNSILSSKTKNIVI